MCKHFAFLQLANFINCCLGCWFCFTVAVGRGLSHFLYVCILFIIIIYLYILLSLSLLLCIQMTRAMSLGLVINLIYVCESTKKSKINCIWFLFCFFILFITRFVPQFGLIMCGVQPLINYLLVLKNCTS